MGKGMKAGKRAKGTGRRKYAEADAANAGRCRERWMNFRLRSMRWRRQRHPAAVR